MEKRIKEILNGDLFYNKWIELRSKIGYDSAFYLLSGIYLSDFQCAYLLEHEDVIPEKYEW